MCQAPGSNSCSLVVVRWFVSEVKREKTQQQTTNNVVEHHGTAEHQNATPTPHQSEQIHFQKFKIAENSQKK